MSTAVRTKLDGVAHVMNPTVILRARGRNISKHILVNETQQCQIPKRVRVRVKGVYKIAFVLCPT